MNSIGQMPMNENMFSENENSKFNVQDLIPSLQKAYYNTGYFPIQNPDGSIRFIQNDQEFDAFIDKVQKSLNQIELPF